MAEYDVNPNIYNFGDPIGGFMQGYQAAYVPKQMQQQQQQAAQQQQMNAMKQQMMQQQMQTQPQIDAERLRQMQLQNQYYPQQQRADLDLTNAKIKQAGQPDKPTGEYWGLSQYYNSLPPGQEKDMVKQRLDKLTSPSAGTTVFGPDGKPLVQIGGKPGSINLDSNGNPIATPTTPEQTKLQNTIVGVDTVLPYFDKIVKDLGPYQTTFQQGKLGYEKFANKNLGGNYEGPSTYAEGMASVKSSAEGLLSAFGLRATDQNIKNMMDIMMPQHGEATPQYTKRATKQAADFLNLQKQAQSKSQGIPLGNQWQANQAPQQPHPQDTLTLRNPSTGETQQMSRIEAQQRGLI